MKISLKTSIEKLAILDRIVGGIYCTKPSMNLMENVQRSIAFDVTEKLTAKSKSVVKKHNNLFDSTKEISISLKYHEAWSMREVLRDLIINCENDFERHAVQTTINKLDKNLN